MTATKRSIDDLYNELLEIKATQNIILNRMNQSDSNDLRRATAPCLPKATKRQRLSQGYQVSSMNDNVSTTWPALFQSESTTPESGSSPINQVSVEEKMREATSPPKRASLLGIPFEIRVEIYKLMLTNCPSVIVNPHHRLESSRRYIAPFQGIHICALLKVSKQVNTEAKPLLWSVPRFYFSDLYSCHIDFDEGTERCKLITSLRVTIGSRKNIPKCTPERRHQLNSQAISFQKLWFGPWGACCKFSGLRHLELDFRPWDLQEMDEFPRRLLEDFKKQYLQMKLTGVQFMGLETHPKVMQELEQAMVVVNKY